MRQKKKREGQGREGREEERKVRGKEGMKGGRKEGNGGKEGEMERRRK